MENQLKEKLQNLINSIDNYWTPSKLEEFKDIPADENFQKAYNEAKELLIELEDL
jgi:hypothetical protein